MCIKVQFSSESEARHTSAGFSRSSKVGLRIYLCKECGAWHLATKKRGMKKHKRLKYPFHYDV